MLADLKQSAPCRAMVPRGDDLPTAAFITTCGGLTSGDSVAFDLELEVGTAAVATTQAAEKIYRGRLGDAPARVQSRVAVAEGAYAEWLPQETILFNGSRLERRTRFDLAADARVLACELRVLGRAAHGELFSHGFLSDRVEVRRAEKLEWLDAVRLAEPFLLQKALQSPAGFGGHPAIGTIFYAAPDAPSHLVTARDILEGEAGAKAAATAWDNILVARFLAADIFLLRRAAARFITGFRAHLGQAPVMPSLWSL